LHYDSHGSSLLQEGNLPDYKFSARRRDLFGPGFYPGFSLYEPEGQGIAIVETIVGLNRRN
jgi:hypothetical protein